MLCEICSPINLFRLQLLTSNNISDSKAKPLNLEETVITKLTEDAKHTGHLIAHNSYFIFFRLAKNLLANDLFSVVSCETTKKKCSTNSES